jgi:hypothetical protein
VHVIAWGDKPRFPNGPFGGGWLFEGQITGEVDIYQVAMYTAWDSLMQNSEWAQWFLEHRDAIGASHSSMWVENRLDLSIRRRPGSKAVDVGVPVSELRTAPDLIAYLRAFFVTYLTRLAQVLEIPAPPTVPD